MAERDIVANLGGRAQRDDTRGTLEASIGRQVRNLRKSLDMTVTELAKQAQLSPGMLSKIENGLTSPSLTTLHALSLALNAPITAFLRIFEEQRDAIFVRAGEGLTVDRRGTRSGHRYQLLGHSSGQKVTMEPSLVTLTEKSEVFPVFQHAGSELIYMLEGEMEYRHGGATYVLRPGDSLFFDAVAPHGPEKLIELPIRFLSVISSAGSEED